VLTILYLPALVTHSNILHFILKVEKQICAFNILYSKTLFIQLRKKDQSVIDIFVFGIFLDYY